MSNYSEATGKHRIAYDDGQVEKLRIKEEDWRALSTNRVRIPEITSIQKEALHEYFKTFEHKEFMLH